MNLCTLSGLYENARTVTTLVGGSNLADQLIRISRDPRRLGELSLALESLASHVRVAGLDEIIRVEVQSR